MRKAPAAPQASRCWWAIPRLPCEFESPRDGDFFTPGRPVKYAVAVTDAEDGASSAKPEEFGAAHLGQQRSSCVPMGRMPPAILAWR